MIYFQEIIKKTLLKQEEKFFHGISFIIISLITIHIAVYFNFYKFSSNWLELESKKTTFIISNSVDEKKIPLDVTERITNYLSAKSEKIEFYVIESNLIKESLGLTNLSDMSGLSLPFIFQIVTDDKLILDEVYASVISISENRLIEKYSHQDQLFEISSLVNRIKLIIFMMFLVIITLFAFLVMNIVKAALISNYKFLEMLQIMGASSLELAKNISQSIIKKILPGAVLSLIFVFLGVFVIDMRSYYWQLTPEWWLSLRSILTLCVIIFLFVNLGW